MNKLWYLLQPHSRKCHTRTEDVLVWVYAACNLSCFVMCAFLTSEWSWTLSSSIHKLTTLCHDATLVSMSYFSHCCKWFYIISGCFVVFGGFYLYSSSNTLVNLIVGYWRASFSLIPELTQDFPGGSDYLTIPCEDVGRPEPRLTWL